MRSAQNLDDLFGKFLNGNCSTEELQQLFKHFHTSDEAILRELIETELFRPDNETDALTDEQKAHLADLGDKIKMKLFSAGKTKGFVRKLLPYAAAILVFFVAGIYYLNTGRVEIGQTTLTSRYGDDIAPGGNKAMITLDDGTHVELDESKAGIVVSDSTSYTDGTVLNINKTRYVTLTTPRGGQYQIKLADGSNVWLNTSSSLKYPIEFGDSVRKVELSGEAFFEVSKNEKVPFIVATKEQSATVLGTEFNISNYEEQHGVFTTLISGSVEIENSITKKKIKLSPDQQSFVDFEKTSARQIEDPGDFIAWRTGYIIKTDASIQEIIPHLERWYDVSFDLKVQPTGRAYVALNRETNLSEVLDALEINYKVRFKIAGRRVLVTN